MDKLQFLVLIFAVLLSKFSVSGVQGFTRSPPQAESILVIGCPMEPANLAPLVKFSMQSCNVHLGRVAHVAG